MTYTFLSKIKRNWKPWYSQNLFKKDSMFMTHKGKQEATEGIELLKQKIIRKHETNGHGSRNKGKRNKSVRMKWKRNRLRTPRKILKTEQNMENKIKSINIWLVSIVATLRKFPKLDRRMFIKEVRETTNHAWIVVYWRLLQENMRQKYFKK